jgi:hypothetical protein
VSVNPGRTPKLNALDETATISCRFATVRTIAIGGSSTFGTFFGRLTGGGIGFMYDGPLARMPGVMQVPRVGMNSLGRPVDVTFSSRGPSSHIWCVQRRWRGGSLIGRPRMRR